MGLKGNNKTYKKCPYIYRGGKKRGKVCNKNCKGNQCALHKKYFKENKRDIIIYIL
jgi:hypothetical protein